ncbi:MAG: hypothetical protein NTX97_08880 [Bacteroidetes bacterium]|nr:hypothetical protein [Bacteroidota bacterium]
MKPHKIFFAFFLSVTLLASSCKKDKDEETPTPSVPAATSGSLALHFENMVGDSALVMNTESYVTANNDTITVSAFKYYISNIVLTKSGGGTYVENESYHLIDASDLLTGEFTLPNVPFGDYTGITFMIGVDSTRNVSGAQTGALDPVNGMYMGMGAGYIQATLEGLSPQSTSGGHMFMYQVAGFQGIYNPLKTISPTFSGGIATVTSSVIPEIHFKTNLLEWFTTPNNISISAVSMVMSVNSTSLNFADNYADMISVEHIHN